MSTDPVEGNILQVIRELNERVNRLERRSVRVNELSEMTADAGLLESGEIRVHSDANNPKEPGAGFSGVRILGSFEEGGIRFGIVGMNNDVLQAGMSAEDGTILAGNGSVILDQNGITAIAGYLANWIIEQHQISADVGSVFINSQTPAVGLGATGYKIGKGIWLGKDAGTYKFFAGSVADNNYIAFDGTVLDVKGLVAETADITKLVKVGASAPFIHIDGVNKTIQTSDFVSDSKGWLIDSAGNAEFNNIRARGEIVSSVFTKGEIVTTSGTFGVFKSSGVLLADVTTGTTFTIDIQDPASGHAQLFVVGDILRMKTGVSDNWMTVTAVSDQVSFYRYTCQLESGSPATFTTGAPAVNYGMSGQGFLILTADAMNAPYYSVQTHQGQPWLSTTEQVRLGNLRGFLGEANHRYGIGMGTPDSYMTYNPVDGLRIQGVGAVMTYNRIPAGITVIVPQNFAYMTGMSLEVTGKIEVSGEVIILG